MAEAKRGSQSLDLRTQQPLEFDHIPAAVSRARVAQARDNSGIELRNRTTVPQFGSGIVRSAPEDVSGGGSVKYPQHIDNPVGFEDSRQREVQVYVGQVAGSANIPEDTTNDQRQTISRFSTVFSNAQTNRLTNLPDRWPVRSEDTFDRVTMDIFNVQENGHRTVQDPIPYQTTSSGLPQQQQQQQLPHPQHQQQRHQYLQHRQQDQQHQHQYYQQAEPSHQPSYLHYQNPTALQNPVEDNPALTDRPAVMLQHESSRQGSTFSEGVMNSFNLEHPFAFTNNGDIGSSSSYASPKGNTRAQATRTQAYSETANAQQSMPSPPPTRQGPVRPAREYYSLVAGSDQPSLMPDYKTEDSEENSLEPSSGKSTKIPSGISGGKIYELAANQNLLATLGEVHTHLSIKALRDQKRAGQVIELGKEQAKKTGRKTRAKDPRKPKRESISSMQALETNSEAGPGPSTLNHRASYQAPELPMMDETAVQVQTSGYMVPSASMDQSYNPSPVHVLPVPHLAGNPMSVVEEEPQMDNITRLSPSFPMRNVPFGPYGRPWTASRPSTSQAPQPQPQYTRPVTQGSNTDSRPSTANLSHGYIVHAGHYLPQAAVDSGQTTGTGHAQPMYLTNGRPVSRHEKGSTVSGTYLADRHQHQHHIIPNHSSSSMPPGLRLGGRDHLERREVPPQGGSNRIHSPYVYSHDQRYTAEAHIPAGYPRSPYEPVTLRPQDSGGQAYDGYGQSYDGYGNSTTSYPSVPPTPQTMQHTPHGRMVPMYTANSLSSSGPSHTSSGSLPSRHSRRSALSSGGHAYVSEQQQQHPAMESFRSIGPASSNQIAEIYGNSTGAQESPFSYHPPPTATTTTVTAPPTQMFYQPHETHGEVTYALPLEAGSLGGGQQQQQAPAGMAHYIMNGRNQRRRPSLPIESLVDEVVEPMESSHHSSAMASGQEPPSQVYYTVPYASVLATDPSTVTAGYGFPSDGRGGQAGATTTTLSGTHAVYPQAIPRGQVPPPHVEWESHSGGAEDPLVGQMDAKARALLEGNERYRM
ncbi:hypothetical protein QFC19_002268 [Naganishia cerealis]|uniref:Uncharacterized protein n=1 Tax=Naganishia cerealis TaxID=610337 RepID=A0ACC2WBW4_9TREE|nr:hypothetical protein QFC19_002268 [Naganishia cerealis]